MAISITELAEVAPASPLACCVVSNRWIVAANGTLSGSVLMPYGSFAVMDATTGAAKAYTGLGPIFADAIGSYGSYAWAWNSNGSTLHRIDPATGGITYYPTYPVFSSGGAPMCCAVNGYVVAFSSASNQIKVFNTSTSTCTTYTVSGLTGCGGRAAVGTDIFVTSTVSGTKAVRRFDPSTGTFTAASLGVGAPTESGGGVTVGDYAYFPNFGSIVRCHTSTMALTSFSHSATPGGNYASGLTAHSDGNIYGYSSSDYLIGFDPVTGDFGKAALAPSRTERHEVVSADGKLWIPSGEPFT